MASGKSSGCGLIFIVSISIALLFVKWYIAVGFFLVSIAIMIYVAIDDAKKDAENRKILMEFPEADEHGMPMLKLLDRVHLSGVTKTHNGTNPQSVIWHMKENEQVFFQRPQIKGYPNAVLVVDKDGDPLGWIPERFAYQEDIAKRLDEGTTVLGRINEVVGGDGDKSFGCFIDIARYEKGRASKTNLSHLPSIDDPTTDKG